jgi:endoglucanase
MNPHHRVSSADGITNPIPGLVAGGPQNSATSDACTTLPYVATSYNDITSCFTTNEVTINWNAPFVYLSAALGSVNPAAVVPFVTGLENNDNYSVFPNPFAEQTAVEIHYKNTVKMNLSIMDTKGVLVYAGDNLSTNEKVQINLMAVGVYIVQARYDGKITRFKMAKFE